MKMLRFLLFFTLILAPFEQGFSDGQLVLDPIIKCRPLGDLSPQEIQRIQEFVDRWLDDDFYVVGSAAKGTRRNPCSNFPLGKNPVHEKSDIDYLTNIRQSSALNDLCTGQYHGFDRPISDCLPDIDRWGVFTGDPDLTCGPAIRFRCGRAPEFLPTLSAAPRAPRASSGGAAEVKVPWRARGAKIFGGLGLAATAVECLGYVETAADWYNPHCKDAPIHELMQPVHQVENWVAEQVPEPVSCFVDQIQFNNLYYTTPCPSVREQMLNSRCQPEGSSSISNYVPWYKCSPGVWPRKLCHSLKYGTWWE